MNSRLLFVLCCLCLLLPFATIQQDIEFVSQTTSDESPVEQHQGHLPSELKIGSGIANVLVVGMDEVSIPSARENIASFLFTQGIPVETKTSGELVTQPSPVLNASVIILDASIGSNNGSTASDQLSRVLLASDVPVIMMGRAAWLLHHLRGTDTPIKTATSDTVLHLAVDYAEAVFLSYPNEIEAGVTLANTAVDTPLDSVQTSKSRIVNLTASSSAVPFLRYDSYPLDSFLFASETIDELTAEGKNLLENIVCFASSLGESSTADAIAAQQETEGFLSGGFWYPHEATVSSTYWTARSAKDICNTSQWNQWVAQKAALVHSILAETYTDLGDEYAFADSRYTEHGELATAHGLWLVAELQLTTEFNVSGLVEYLSSRQQTDGGFDNDVITTYHVLQGLLSSGALSQIDTTALEEWLRECQIKGSETSDPDCWGGIAVNPDATTPRNSYAAACVLSLEILGQEYQEPTMLVQWIQTRTSNGDGSYNNSLGNDAEITAGTAFSLTTMDRLGMLSPENRTNGISWLEEQQLPSGGFGLGFSNSDIMAKTEETWPVALCVNTLGLQDELISSSIRDYLEEIETPLGFEVMEALPTMMWSSYLTRASRYSHISAINRSKLSGYLLTFDAFAMYPIWNNLTAGSSIEYGYDQYRIRSVWANLFGIEAFMTAGRAIPSEVASQATNYVTLSQYIGGHFKPTSYAASFTASMQHSVAAVEALYQLDQLDFIQYRSALESAVLSEYNSGSWSSRDWTIRPYCNQQSAVDLLSTRAGLRLGLITSSMANEIATVIENRMQYDDLWALSNDVATLALLKAHSFDVSLDSVSTVAVMDSLQTRFTKGWFNSSILWQPVFTADVLRMISTLGLRLRNIDLAGTRLETSIAEAVSLGENLGIGLDIISNITEHTVRINAFDSWAIYENVSSADMIYLAIPEDRSALGPLNVTVAVTDYAAIRAYSKKPVMVYGNLSGYVDVDSSQILQGYILSGTATWQLASGSEAGNTNVTVSLHNGTFNEETFYVNCTSPFDFEVPTTDYSEGNYTLAVTFQKLYCEEIVLNQEITIIEPLATELESSDVSDARIGQPLTIAYSLTFSCNESPVEGQNVTLQVMDFDDNIVHTDSMMSAAPGNSFEWVPNERGNYAYVLQTENNGSIEGTATEGVLLVYEEPYLEWMNLDEYNQYEHATLTARLLSQDGDSLDGFWVSVEIISPSNGVTEADCQTNSSGHLSLVIEPNENGNYALLATFEEADFLKSCEAESSFVSFSSSNSTFLSPAGSSYLIIDDVGISILLEDSNSSAIANEPVSVEIKYLPDSVVLQEALLTDGSGLVFLTWNPDTAGDYRITTSYDGTISRGAASSHVDVTVRIPVTLSIDISNDLLCAEEYTLTVSAQNHLSNPIDDLEVFVTILLPNGTADNRSGTTSGGSIDFSWTPSIRGVSHVEASSARQSVYEAAAASESVDIFDEITADIQWLEDPLAPSYNQFMIHLSDSYGRDLKDVEVGVTILLNGIQTMNATSYTSQTGRLSLEVYLDAPGMVAIEIHVEEQYYLLQCSDTLESVVLGISQLILQGPGTPIGQGTTLGIVGELTDWAGEPLVYETVELVITRSGVGKISSVNLTTGEQGEFVYAYQFDEVGDFQIIVTYAGSYLNASAMDSFVQRVYVIPILILEHDWSCLVGQDTQLSMLVKDALDNAIPNRSLGLSIEMDNQVVFEVSLLSGASFKDVHWTPGQRGLAAITLVHTGGDYYLENTTDSTMSVMAEIVGSIQLNTTSCDVFASVEAIYNLSGETQTSGVSVVFEALDMNLIPLWTFRIDTDGSGIAIALYPADDACGNIILRARPEDDQYLVGGESQKQLTVKTEVRMTSGIINPISNEQTNITLSVYTELDTPIDAISLDIQLVNPYGEIVDLGGWLGQLSLTVSEGKAEFSFTSEEHGYHTLSISFAGSPLAYGFENESMLMIYSRTSVIANCSQDLEVGDTLHLSAKLTDAEGHALANMNLIIELTGPSISDQVTLTTNSTGYVEHSSILEEEGLWQVSVRFDGLGAYLQKESSIEVDVRYGTEIQIELLDQNDVIAGIAPLNLSLLLIDSGGVPLEGRDIVYNAYHEELGLVFSDEVEQYSHRPENISIAFTRAGNHTITLQFLGTDHYHPSSTTMVVFVRGTTEIAIDAPGTIDRASNGNLTIQVLDENADAISDLEGLDYELIGPNEFVDLKNRTILDDAIIQLSLFALDCGSYQLNAIFEETTLRLGNSTVFKFDVTTATRIVPTHQQLPGNLREKHSMTIVLVDSLNWTINDGTIRVSLYNPDGDEVYGSSLSTSTAIDLAEGPPMINWTPKVAGNYTLTFSYAGTEFREACELSVVVLSRYATSLTFTHLTETAYYDEDLKVTLRLARENHKIGGVPIQIEVLYENQTVATRTVTTDWVGSAKMQFNLEYAGNYDVVVSYRGSELNNPCSVEGQVSLLPEISGSLSGLSESYLGAECKANITLVIAGARENSSFMVMGELYGPEGNLVKTVNESASWMSSIQVTFSPTTIGEHVLNLTLTGLPAIENASISVIFSIESPPINIPMSESAIPLGGGLGIIGILAVAVRRRIKSVIESLPEEWKG
ncbi:MAG: prenyltransferase/squalene oxidase repeat-containing protein [Promethearchaeia archaeon]